MNIAFIGTGKLGMPCAEEIAKAGHSVTGYDVASVTSDLVDIKDTIAEAVKFAKIVFVAVPTPHDPSYDGRAPTAHLEPKDFSYDIVKDVLRECNSVMNSAQMIVLISTVLPGTVRRELAPLITQARFIYNPYLIAMGSVAWDMVNPEMVIIGTEDGSETGDASLLINFYKELMQNNPRYSVGTWEEAESIKIFYNTFISAKLSLVNMIQDVAMKLGNMNVDVVTDALANSTQRIMGPKYMTAGMGDGGPCHPRDNIALRYMAKELNLEYDLFHAIMNSREVQARNLANFLCDLSKEHELPVLIHGYAYKPDVPYTEGSYSSLVAHYCGERGFHPMIVDPLTHPDPGPYSAVVLLAHNPSVTYNYINNQQSNNLYCKLNEDSVIVDPWRSFSDTSYKVIHYGNTRIT
jgi:UDPglucose 6-dehydrogenase